MRRDVDAQDQLGNLEDVACERVIGSNSTGEIISAVPASLQIGGCGLARDRSDIDYLEQAGTGEMVAQSFADHLEPSVLRFMGIRSAGNDTAPQQLELEDSRFFRGKDGSRPAASS